MKTSSAETKEALSRAVARSYLALVPCILGLAFARVSFSVLTPFNFSGTLQPQAHRLIDITIPTTLVFGGDAQTIVYDMFHVLRLGLFALCLIYLAFRSDHLQKRVVKRIAYACTALSLAASAALLVSTLLGHPSETLALAASMVGALAITGLLFFWLRCARHLNIRATMAYVFLAYFLSKGLLYVLPSLGAAAEYAASFALAGVQLYLIAIVRTGRSSLNRLATDIAQEPVDHAGDRADEKKSPNWYIIGNTATLLLFSVILSLLRLNFENESLSSLFSPTNMALGVLFSFVFMTCLFGSIWKAPFAATTVCWLMVFVLASTIMFLNLATTGLGAHIDLLTMVLDDFNRILRWFIIIRFMHLGKRDPYFYALLINIAYLLPLWLASFVPVFAMETDIVAGVLLVGGVALFAVQSIQSTIQARRDLAFAQRQHDDQLRLFEKRVLQSVGPDDPSEGGAEASMRRDAIVMGAQFMLSKREVEVLTLYALGHTQAHISEELSVASTTVRTHIRNIYQKTDLHSRQDILNYMAEYVRK